MGKTAFGLNIGMRAACEYNVPTAIFSLEMSMEQLMMRMLCARGKVNLKNLRTGFLTDEDWARLYNAADELSKAPIFIDDTPALEPLELRARCRRLKSEKGLGLVIIDYLQLMHGGARTENRQQEISFISRSLKASARELKVPVMALSQLSRQVELRGKDAKPQLSDLRESGAIEQDADVIISLWTKGEEDVTGKVKVFTDLLKNRNGYSFGNTKDKEYYLWFEKRRTQFHDVIFADEGKF
jgi:replicative DNA helicase